jgi:hypothetical protein
LVWTKGEPGSFRSSEAVERGFCRDCGTPLTYNALETDRICISIGSLDHPERVNPEIQYGIEAKQPAFDILHTLPSITTEDDNPPEVLAKMKSRQHPDQD